MASCIEIETASLVFASLSLFSSVLGSCVSIVSVVHVNVLMGFLAKTGPKHVDRFQKVELGLTYYGLYMNVGLAIFMAVMVVSLIFSIILTKGLLSKKAHLVKAYFIYGVTSNTISGFLAVLLVLIYNVHIGLLSLLGCFLYSIILIIIMRTYQKLSDTDCDQYGHKKLEAEKPTV